MVYQWAENFSDSNGVSADRAGRELERIRKEKGGLTPQVVVECARSGVSPLHGLFVWDDKVAADRYRLAQANTVVHSVMVQVDDDERMESRFIRAFVGAGLKRAEATPVRARLTQELTATPVSSASRLEHAWSALLAWREKYGDIEDFGVIVRSIDRIRASAEEGSAA